jgi:Icc protein
VLDHVRREQSDFDYLILTGDLAHDESLETYLILREMLAEWIDCCRIIPGNHDNPIKLRQAFPEHFSDSGPLTFKLVEGGWRIIGLDTNKAGETKGHIEEDQLEWLRSELLDDPYTPTLLFLHHPPIPINVPWLDKIGLDNPTEFIRLIEASTQVKVVCSGHVHQEFIGRIGTADFYTTPSTCVQFGTGVEKSIDIVSPGYRTFLLDDDYHTKVHRVLSPTTTPQL